MSKPRFKAIIKFSNVTDAEGVRSQIHSKLLSIPLYRIVNVSTMNDSAVFFASGDVMFNDTGSRDSFKTWVLGKLMAGSIVGGWIDLVKGAFLRWHDCSHEDLSVHDCRDSSYAEAIL